MWNMENEDLGTCALWVLLPKQIRSVGVSVDRFMIKAKANCSAARFEINNFQCSIGWLHCFKVRTGISMHKMSGKSETVDPLVLNDCLQWYSPQNIYNAGKTGSASWKNTHS
jgi:hypothetical protein